MYYVSSLGRLLFDQRGWGGENTIFDDQQNRWDPRFYDTNLDDFTHFYIAIYKGIPHLLCQLKWGVPHFYNKNHTFSPSHAGQL